MALQLNLSTFDSLMVTTSCKWPPPLSVYFVNDRFIFSLILFQELPRKRPLLRFWFWLLIWTGWTVVHLTWCAGRYPLTTSRRLALGARRKRCQKGLEPAHSLTLLYSVCWSCLIDCEHTAPSLAYSHGKTWWCWEASEGTLSSVGSGITHLCWRGQKPWWGNQRPCIRPLLFSAFLLELV